MLSNLLGKLQDQSTEGLFTYSATIVDNDDGRSAQDVVKEWQSKSKIRIDYHCEPEQNIALARNRAVENAKGDYIAFIDDDEFPDSTWLVNLFKTIQQCKCAGVLGPVRPYFESTPPRWIVKGRICERPAFVTGTILTNHSDTRTGNVMLDRAIFNDEKTPFNPVFGKTGGEDVDFFGRMLKKGSVFIWCNEAPVYEIVPPERFTRMYHLRRALLRGSVNSDKAPFFSVYTVKSIIAFTIYTTALPFLCIVGHHMFMKYLIKDCDHVGKLLGLLGVKIPTNR